MSDSSDTGTDTLREEGLECPHCGLEWDDVMEQPALKRAGWNPRSGRLYECSSCHDRVTEAEMETGESLGTLIETGRLEEFTPERRRKA